MSQNSTTVSFVIRAKLLYWKAVASNGFKKKTILCYTQKPKPMHTLYTICSALGYKIIDDPRKRTDLIMHFEDWTMRKENKVLNDLRRTQRVINADCRNISKAKVDRVFKEVFGYGITIDPRQYAEPYVMKSNMNATHDGKVLRCSTEPEEGYVYQKLINNEYDEGTVTDIRISVIDGAIPMVIRRLRNISDRFGNTDKVSITDLGVEFTQNEIENILLFCNKFGLDYGDLDILRDKDDGKMYIVDVNNTPYGPVAPKHMSREEYALYLRTLAETFASRFGGLKKKLADPAICTAGEATKQQGAKVQ